MWHGFSTAGHRSVIDLNSVFRVADLVKVDDSTFLSHEEEESEVLRRGKVSVRDPRAWSRHVNGYLSTDYSRVDCCDSPTRSL